MKNEAALGWGHLAGCCLAHSLQPHFLPNLPGTPCTSTTDILTYLKGRADME